jgi:hypothetical protein
MKILKLKIGETTKIPDAYLRQIVDARAALRRHEVECEKVQMTIRFLPKEIVDSLSDKIEAMNLEQTKLHKAFWNAIYFATKLDPKEHYSFNDLTFDVLAKERPKKEAKESAPKKKAKKRGAR